LVYLAKSHGLSEVAEYWEQVVKINEYQKNRFTAKILQYFHNNVKNIRISILGWAFKKNTNDSRESASIFVAVNLLESGAKLNIYDPMVPAKRVIIDITLLLEDKGFNKNQVSKMLKRVSVSNTLQKCIKGTKAIVITTEWEEFKNNIFILNEVKSTKPPYLFDGRNISSIPSKQNTYYIGN
jgi:UDPglucose 6-dehydrogenase